MNTINRKTIGGGVARVVVLSSASDTPCGVEAFARRIAQTAGACGESLVLDARASARLRGPGTLVINLPVVAWKRQPIAPIRAAATARARGMRVTVVLHEWDDLHPKRRATYMPLLLLADKLLFSCPLVERQFARAWPSCVATRHRGTVPVPPNLMRPERTQAGSHSRVLAGHRAAGRLVLGYFGSIYPKKQPLAVLEVAAELKRRGHAPFVVFAGSFIRGSDTIEQDFAARVTTLGLAGDVMVTGYIRSEAEVFGLFDEVDVFLYRFAEGLTPRRSSVLACLQSGKPVVVNAPLSRDEFDHHPAYRALLEDGSLRLVPTDAETAVFADAVLAARDRPAGNRFPIDAAATWAQALAAIEAAGRPDLLLTPRAA